MQSFLEIIDLQITGVLLKVLQYVLLRDWSQLRFKKCDLEKL